MTLRWLSREGRSPAPVRVTGTPLAVRVVDVPAMAAPEMPPQPQPCHPDTPPPLLLWSAPFATFGGLDERFDPCGGMPITTTSSDENGEAE